MGQDSLNIAGLFPGKSADDWRARVEKDLKGEAPSSLKTTTLDGIERSPLYTRDDAVQGSQLGFPGLAPFIRGATAANDWKIRQEYDDPRLEVSRAAIAEDLSRGVEALWLRLAPQWGIRVLTVDELDTLLADVDLEEVSVCLEAGHDAFQIAAAFVSLAKRRKCKLKQLRGGFGVDPFGTLASTGAAPGGLNAKMDELADLARWADKNAPSMRSALVSARPYEEAGATDGQQLGWALATSAEYLRRLLEGGLGLDRALRQFYFSLPISGDFFSQVAKLRAARLLWTKLVAASGGDLAGLPLRIHAATSRFNKTDRDPWVNMIRCTSEVTAAVLGGAQSIAVIPFDESIGASDAFARRVARNTQSVLREESHLGRVADPTGGSWYVEQLTDALARRAWSIFQDIEGQGGFARALRRGAIANALSEVSGERRAGVASRRTPIVGVSEFANVEEKAIERHGATPEELEEALQDSFAQLDHTQHRKRFLALAETVHNVEAKPGVLFQECVDAATEGVDLLSLSAVLRHGLADLHIEPARHWRLADSWEALRAGADEQLADRGHRPTALLVNLGPLPSHIARSTWTKNVLAAAGISVIDPDGFAEVYDAVDNWNSSEADLAVICGSDATYRNMLEGTVVALRSEGCDLLYVAGKLGDKEAALRAAGVIDFLYAGQDLVSVMEMLNEVLGAAE